MSDLLFEPRSFWSIQQFQQFQFDNPITPDQGIIQFRREHFFNGTRHPITLTRAVIAPICYTFRRRETPNQGPYRSTMSVLNRAKILVSAPQRQHYSRYPIALTGIVAEPTAEPNMAGHPTIGFTSGMWGATYLKFDHAMILPRLGSLELDISASRNTFIQTPNLNKFGVAFYEEGGLLPGAARTREQQTLLAHSGRNDKEEGFPFPPGNLSEGGEFGGGATETVNPWPPQHHFSSKVFDEQESTRGGSSSMTGISVHIDQISWDDELPAATAPVPIEPIAPFSLRVGSRIRSTNAGSKEWWWRPGAPLALVFDTITPSLVYKLPVPITLGPGDTLDVELELPVMDSAFFAPNIPGSGQYQIGVSFNGYAVIEG